MTHEDRPSLASEGDALVLVQLLRDVPLMPDELLFLRHLMREKGAGFPSLRYDSDI